jgi:Haspin like kinase domain
LHVDCQSCTPCFVEVKRVAVVRGRYPQRLLDAWNEFKDGSRRTENDDPACFDDEQLFLVMLCGHGGTDLEVYKGLTFLQAKSVLTQVRATLSSRRAQACKREAGHAVHLAPPSCALAPALDCV